MTPFAARMTAPALKTARVLEETPRGTARADRYALLAELTLARRAFGISDRDLAVLAALVSFHPERVLCDTAMLVVFPSNAALGLRAHGMAESTLRRHLAALVKAGLVARHDSPNGKRYAARGPGGGISRAFGFDLRPLLLRAGEISEAAEAERERLAKVRALREETVVRLRDIAKLGDWLAEAGLPPEQLGPLRADQAELLRGLRRKLDLDAAARLNVASADLHARMLTEIDASSCLETVDLSGDDSQNERHIQSSDRIPIERKRAVETRLADSGASHPPRVGTPREDRDDMPALPEILARCRQIAELIPGGIANWHGLTQAAETVRPMLGIGGDVWQMAKSRMGSDAAAVTLACILEKFAVIRNPGAYLRVLSVKAEQGRFTPGPMLRALKVEGTPA
ncbi:Replication protein C [Profundibacterium mesophilum KAUST100406-0324]|uniref:Replication protein C n=2 Tax=Profundibacterium TaxID=1258570 RepID=A0A921NSS4_9RHOB|nr:Replication protein C [Profundibacterium mesophilum KAUST100406-0324]